MPRAASGYGLFFREFLRNFHTTGAVLPSGPRLCKALARYVGSGDGVKRVLEVGPGTGVVTRRIVPKLGEGDCLDLVEINPDFAKRLLRDIERDPLLKPAARRIVVHQIPIEQLGRDQRYDVIVSGLPLNNFPAELVESILLEFSQLLTPGGTLSFFEYIAVRRVKASISGRRERKRLRQIGGILSRTLTKHEVRRDCILANVPPAWVHHLRFS